MFFAKRFFDISAAVPGIVVLSPVFLVIGLLVRRDGGPVIFAHERVGFRGRPFRVYKFRTMVPNAHLIGPAVTGGSDPRITPIGRVLRKYKLDELPQLFNVLEGSMSLVGPRPEVRKYVDAYPERYAALLARVKPGITDNAAIEFVDEERMLAGVADVEGTYIREILPRKLELYESYAAHPSLWTDMRLILQTLAKIVR